MHQPKENVSKFAHNLGEIIRGDESDPDVYIAHDTSYSIDEEGVAHKEGGCSEAVLIIRGPEEHRAAAVSKLLSQLDL